MLHGKTSGSTALANTAILMRLIEGLIERGIVARADASSWLEDAADRLASGPNATGNKVIESVEIIRKDLLPRISQPA
jgi:hypothetical protein